MKAYRKTTLILCILVSVFLITASAVASEVAQGECLAYNKEAKTLTLREYDTDFSKSKYGNPTSIEREFDVSKAKIGMLPEPGDILRISYKIEGTSNIALKIMNVSKQDLMKK